MTTKHIFAALLLLTGIAACASDTTTQTTTTAAPGIGSTFTVMDSTFGFSTRTQTFGYTEVAVNGSTIGIIQDNTTDTTWYRAESNGDLHMFPQPSGSRADTILLPFGRQTAISTTETTSSGGTTLVTTTNIVGEGSGSVSIGGKPYDTKKIKVTIFTNTGGIIDTSSVTHWSYSPAIGFWTLQTEEPKFLQGTVQDYDHWSLISFSKK
jgi:hypothetical protein